MRKYQPFFLIFVVLLLLPTLLHAETYSSQSGHSYIQSGTDWFKTKDGVTTTARVNTHRIVVQMASGTPFDETFRASLMQVINGIWLTL